MILRFTVVFLCALVAFWTGRSVLRIFSRPQLPDPRRRTSEIGHRIVALLRGSETDALYTPTLQQIAGLCDEKLPMLLGSREKIRSYLDEGHPGRLRSELAQLRCDVSSSRDDELARIRSRNLRLVEERLENIKRLETLLEKVDAQILNLILTLESFEDRVVAHQLARSTPDFTPELEALLKDVGVLEEEFQRLCLPP